MSKAEDTRAGTELPPEETAEKTVVTEIIFSSEAVLGREDTRRVAFDDTVSTVGPPELRDQAVETTVVDYRRQDAGTVPSWEPTHHDVRPTDTEPAAPPAAPDERSEGVRMAGRAAVPAVGTVTRGRAVVASAPKPPPPPASMDTTPPIATRSHPWLTGAEKRLVVATALVAVMVMVGAYALGYWQAAG